MINSDPDDRQAQVSRRHPQWMQLGVLAAVCVLVIGMYVFVAHSGYAVSSSLNPRDAYYNSLVQGFRAGQLSVKKTVPPALAQLPDPYDRAANAPYDVLDLSYYKGKLYLYFGVTPALFLFWPYVALTGHYLPQEDAVLIFCVFGFLASAGLLYVLWRRYFAEINVGVVAAGTLALGSATFTPFLLARCDVYEVSISCGYAFTMLAVAAVWKALHEPERRGNWLAAASLAYGLAVGARPSLLFGAVILLVPVVQAWRERRKIWVPLVAATGPIAIIGLGLMFYNVLRFGSPLEFGIRYQLAGDTQLARQFFSLRNLWFNFRVYFLEPAIWSSRFPFVHDITAPPLPAGHGGAEHPFGVLTNIPLVWLALAVPLAWRGRPTEERSSLCGFLAAVALLFWTGAQTLGLYYYAAGRYEVEFLPALVLLATIGILGLERALTLTSGSGMACRPVWRGAVRWGWGLLLGFSVAFNLLASVERCAEAHCDLGNALLMAGKTSEAIAQYAQALRLKPDCTDAHRSLAVAWAQDGKFEKAIESFEQVLRFTPDDAKTHRNLGLVLQEDGRLPEAIEQYERALQLKPDYPEAHCNLADVLTRLGRVPEAVEHYEWALRIKPDSVEVHNALALALVRLGRMQEAIGHWEQALRLQPDYAVAHSNLGVALAQLGRVSEAVKHWEQALRLEPNMAEVHFNWGVAMERAGRATEAMEHYEAALRLKPDYLEARKRLAQLRSVQVGQRIVQ